MMELLLFEVFKVCGLETFASLQSSYYNICNTWLYIYHFSNGAQQLASEQELVTVRFAV